MPAHDFFARLGLFTLPEFLDPAACARLCEEARHAQVTMAHVVRGASELVDESSRRTRVADVSAAAVAEIQALLMDRRPAIAQHFHLELSGCEDPQFLVYHPGDFFGAHCDTSDEEHKPQMVRDRRISTVLFLNTHSAEPQPGMFGGGELTVYGLMPGEAGAKYGFPLMAEAGLLVAFPSKLWHAVEPVSHGERFTVVSWYY